MGRKGTSSVMKRKPAPKFWPIHRKEFAWIVKPSAGPHSIEKGLPLAMVLRDIIGIANTRKEAKIIVSKRQAKVDGKTRVRDDFPIGLMDVLSLEEARKFYRVLPSYKGLILHPISEEEAKIKLCRVENKRKTKNGNVQVSFHDGTTMLVKIADPKNPQEDIYKTYDTVKLSLPEKEATEHIRMKENDYAVIIGGKNIGRYGKITEIEKVSAKKREKTLATIEDSEGNRFQTILDFVFTIGESLPLISIPEGT